MAEKFIKDTVKIYLNYVKKHFPYSKVEYTKSYLFFNNSFINLEIIDAYCSSELIDNIYITKLLHGLQEQILLLLNQYPLYHNLVISAIKRNICENILRMTISIYSSNLKDEKTISKISFRDLDETIKGLEIYKQDKFKKLIDVFFGYFGENSIEMHTNFNSEKSDSIAKLVYLNKELTRQEVKALNNFSEQIYNFLITFFPNQFEINDLNFPMSSKKMLHNALGRENYESLFAPN